VEKEAEEAFAKLLKAARKLDAPGKAGNAARDRTPYPRLPSAVRAPVARKWKSLLWSIECAGEYGEEGLRGLAVALSKLLVAEALQQLMLEAKQHSKCGLEAGSLLWDKEIALDTQGATLETLMIRKKRRIEVDMNDAIVLAATWERWRFFRAIANIGEESPWGLWKHDKRNHLGEAWLPWPIVWVMNGNHSVMAATVKGGGVLKCEETYDLSPVLDAVKTDGRRWYRADTGKAFAEVRSLPMAGIFVVGQRLAALQRL
jgi:hypothetical protein